MAIYLNGCPVKLKQTKFSICVLKYSDDLFNELKVKYKSVIFYRHKGMEILGFSFEQQYDSKLQECVKEIDITDEEYSDFRKVLIKYAIKKAIDNAGKNKAWGFNPICLISSKSEEDIIKKVLNTDFPFAALPAYLIDVREIENETCILVDTSVRYQTSYPCNYFYSKGFNLIGRNAYINLPNGERKKVGKIKSYEGNNIICETNGDSQNYASDSLFLIPSYKNIKDYLSLLYRTSAYKINEKLYNAVSAFSNGKNKFSKIKAFANFLKKSQFFENNGIQIDELFNITSKINNFEKPQFTFANSSIATGIEYGLKKFGPYTKAHFDRNNPAICVICSESRQGEVEQFVRKFLSGINEHKYFSNGLEGKFGIGRSTVKIFTFASNTPAGYRKAIENALEYKAGEKLWDLALVQIEKSFKDLNVKDNPYFTAKSMLMARDIPVQDFTIEILQQNDITLGYSLNNMALATYTKMGGVPWLLQSIPTVVHELVIGIGSAFISEGEQNTRKNRVMGITTVFSGSGQYILTGKSNAVSPDGYKDELANVLETTIDKVKASMSWVEGDTIRIVFHSMVKEFNGYEIEAVKNVIKKFKEYNIEYAFVKLSKEHLWETFDTNRNNESKGCLAPTRGQYFKISDYAMLLCLTGGAELKKTNDGHPQCVYASVHKDSTFKDIKYLSNQIFNFSAHSWRSYFVAPLPVTIMYSNLIAYSLGWLNQLPKWDNSCLFQKTGRAKWFL